MSRRIYFLALIILFPISVLHAQWTSLGDGIIPTDHRIWSIKIAKDKSIWAISTFDNFPPTGHFPYVMRSIDEGISWQKTKLTIGKSDYGLDVSPIDSMRAFIALNEIGLYNTINGGKNWEKVESYPYLCQAVHFFNEKEGWTFGADTVAWKMVLSVTKDGGETWLHIGGADWESPKGTSIPEKDSTEFHQLVNFSVNSSYDYHDNIILFGSTIGNYWMSKDKGQNWIRNKSPFFDLGYEVNLVAIKDENTFMLGSFFDDKNKIFINPVVYSTRDGGETWVEGKVNLTTAAIHYIPNTEGTFLISGHNDFLWGSIGTAISYDFGKNWHKIDDTSIITMDFLDENTGFGACCNNQWATANGQIHKWDYKQITSVKESETETEVRLFPNPVRNVLHLKIKPEQIVRRDFKLNVYSINGQIENCKYFHNPYDISINTSNLSSGVYILMIQNGEKIIRKKFRK